MMKMPNPLSLLTYIFLSRTSSHDPGTCTGGDGVPASDGNGRGGAQGAGATDAAGTGTGAGGTGTDDPGTGAGVGGNGVEIEATEAVTGATVMRANTGVGPGVLT